jgi:hypothetical protein
MTGFLEGDEPTISNTTLASFRDLGYVTLIEQVIPQEVGLVSSPSSLFAGMMLLCATFLRRKT